MIKSIEATAKTEEEAIASALAQLGVERDDVSVEVLERSKSGFFGFGAVPAKVRVSYEYIETPVEKVNAFLEGLLERMGVDAKIESSVLDDGSISVRLTGESLGSVIGRRGETLDAIQHITNYAVNLNLEERIRINIDAENYRSKREASLQRLAEKVAAKVVKYHRNMTLEPMNSYERHVIHTALQDYEDVTTFSTGSEPNRRIVIAYARKQHNSAASKN